MQLRNRERKVDVSDMGIEAVENLSIQIGEKVGKICDEAADKINAILAIYGMKAKIAIVFDELEKAKKDNNNPPEETGRKD